VENCLITGLCVPVCPCCVHVSTRTRGRVHIALLIQHATRMRHIVTSFMAPRSTPYVSTLSHKGYDFWKNIVERKMCVLVFSTTFVSKFSILRKIQRDIVINVETSSCKVPIILVGF
jgi:hypothetical protein